MRPSKEQVEHFRGMLTKLYVDHAKAAYTGELAAIHKVFDMALSTLSIEGMPDYPSTWECPEMETSRGCEMHKCVGECVGDKGEYVFTEDYDTLRAFATSKIAALEGDAARYRWISNHLDETYLILQEQKDFDQAIDAARGAGK